MPARGEIVLARFPFTDLTQATLRPVLVLAEVPGPYRDFLVMFISSQVQQAIPSLDVVLAPGDAAFAGSGLKVASVFRVAKVASLSEQLIVGTLGQLDQSTFVEVVARLSNLLATGSPPATQQT